MVVNTRLAGRPPIDRSKDRSTSEDNNSSYIDWNYSRDQPQDSQESAELTGQPQDSQESAELTEEEDDPVSEMSKKRRTKTVKHSFFQRSSVPKEIKTPEKKPPPQSHSSYKWPNFNQQWLWILLPIVLILIGILLKKISKSSEDLLAREAECNATFNIIKRQHPEQEKFVFNSLYLGAKDSQSKVSVYLLMYRNQNALKFIDKVVTATSSCVQGSKEIEPIVLSVKNFTEEMETDYGEMLDLFGEQLKENHIMMVNEIDRVSAKVAQAFHFLCDTYNPYASPAIIYFTLKYNGDPNGNIDEAAMDILRSKWRHALNKNTLDALLTRITDQVLFVR